jgi:hypothetical protein
MGGLGEQSEAAGHRVQSRRHLSLVRHRRMGGSAGQCRRGVSLIDGEPAPTQPIAGRKGSPGAPEGRQHHPSANNTRKQSVTSAALAL